MIEALLIKTVPRAVLRKISLLVNQVKLNTIDKLLFSEAVIKQSEFILFREHLAMPELSRINDLKDNAVIKGLKVFKAIRDVEYILHYKGGCIIEPKRGWALARKRQLIRYSLGTPDARHLKRPSFKYTGEYPRVVHFQKAISLRETSERAYYHFYNDVIAKIPLLLQNHIDLQNIPVIVSAATFEKPFFQEMLQRSPFLHNLNWFVQKNQVVHCNEVIFCKPFNLQKQHFDWLIGQLNFPLGKNGNDRIFLTRNRKRLRYIENIHDLIPLLHKYNFHIADTDNLSLVKQAELFSNASHLIGIHGAGMTNIIFRRNHPLHILEIFPPTGIVPYHYCILAKRYGFRYMGMMGKDNNAIKGSFRVDPAKFEQYLIDLITG